MRRRFIDSYARTLAERSRIVILISLALTGVAAALLPRLEFRSARSGLSTKQNPDQARFAEFTEELGGSAVVVLAEGGTDDQRKDFTEKLAYELRLAKEQIADVFYRLPMDFFRRRALGLAPAEELEKIADTMDDESAQLVALAAARGLHDVHRLLAERMERDISKGRRPEGREGTEGLLTLKNLILAEKRLIEKPAETVAALERLDVFQLASILSPKDTSLRKFAHGGYLTSSDGSLYMCLVQPRSTNESLAGLESLLGTIRAAAEKARAGAEGQAPTAVRYGLTGEAVVAVEESQTVKRDGIRCGLYGAAGIGILAAIAFRRKVAILLVLLTLAMAVLWNTGLTWAIFGGFNLITSAVPVILIGLGTDFGIHVVIAYEVERALGRSPREAVAIALARIGPGLLTGAVTTALAFYAICFMKYRGFQEFGVIAGNGVLLCALAMTSALPALLLLTDRRPPREGSAPLDVPLAVSVREIVKEAPGQLPQTSLLGRAWQSLCRVATAFPVMTCAAALGITVWCFFLARGIGFDYRVENLLPKNAESLRTQERMQGDEALTPEFAVVFCKDREALKTANARAAEMTDLIGRRESILDLIPEGPPAARAALMQNLQTRLRPLTFDIARLQKVDAETLRKSLESLQAVFDRALDLVAGNEVLKEMARLLDSISVTLEATAAEVAKAGPDFASEFSAATARLWLWLADRKAEVDRQLSSGPVLEDEVPPEILGKLKGRKSGRYALYLYPKGSLAERGDLERFVSAVRQIDPAATGYPVVFYASTSLIYQGFSTAVAAAALVIFLTLFLDFRRPTLVLLATLPKILGILWMLGIMRLLGLNYNLANQIVIPLLIGVGLSYGIHIIHGFFSQKKETRSLTALLEHTGGAIVLSGLTTMVGFGSLGLASHRGLSSMGTVLFFGVGAALVASTYLLANILYLIYRPRN